MPEEREIEENLQSELRQTAGREWVEEAAEDEQLTELMRRRRMTLGDVAREMVEKGGRIRAEAGPQTFTGEMVFAGADYAVIERADDLVAACYDFAVWTVVGQQESAGHEQVGGASTMRAHLNELASTGETVQLFAVDGRVLVGSLAVVAADHVEINQDAHRLLLPLAQLVAVVRPRPGF